MEATERRNKVRRREKNGEREVEEEDEKNMEMIPLGAATA